MVSVSGEPSDPKVMLLRLEDIGPGGQFDSLESLGKLRAVLDYLNEQQVKVHLAVIPRWLDIKEDNRVYEKSLDQANDPYIQAFNQILRHAEQTGNVIGMHGYTHQVGDKRRSDGHHESGIGNELAVNDVPVTWTAAYAKERIDAGLQIFKAAGFVPKFWEAPHYHFAAEQDKVFRSYFGLLYENELEKPNQLFVNMKNDRPSGFGTSSLGAAYIPTPYSYVPYNQDEKIILNQVGQKKLASFFYHPFLEFKFLQAVKDHDGVPMIRDGVPVYQYTGHDKSKLQRIVKAMKEKGYTFSTIHDVTPFTPANSISLGFDKGAGKVRTGDVTASGQSSVVRWMDTGDVVVQRGEFRGMRNADPAPVQTWLKLPRNKGDQFTLFDDNDDGKKDLWVLRASGKVEVYHSNGEQFVFYRSWNMKVKEEWSDLQAFRPAKGECVIAGVSKDMTKLYGFELTGNELKLIPPLKAKSTPFRRLSVTQETPNSPETLFVPKKNSDSGVRLEYVSKESKWKFKRISIGVPVDSGEIRLGDFNGDGREDALLWDDARMQFTVYLRDKADNYQRLAQMGSWGMPGGKLILDDFDGNGKMDIGLIENEAIRSDQSKSNNAGQWVLDVALSHQTGEAVLKND
ncbi:DUF2334 domain-containing protein [Paenibacillus radicibacter]|uniref:DUF2334 domain-containing protein n=1 Tax=Paenibacillus radicibacter TaxID=2972488 RepID=UPI002158EB5C|nr:DUF2334 domain-containing protein [Paenibacillus radicibacter]